MEVCQLVVPCKVYWVENEDKRVAYRAPPDRALAGKNPGVSLKGKTP